MGANGSGHVVVPSLDAIQIVINRYMVVVRAPKINLDTTPLEERSDLLNRVLKKGWMEVLKP